MHYAGSSWAFSAMVTIKGIVQISTGELISLFEQQLVDCASDNPGYDGGLIDIALTYITQNNGIASEADYQYKETEGIVIQRLHFIIQPRYQVMKPCSRKLRSNCKQLWLNSQFL